MTERSPVPPAGLKGGQGRRGAAGPEARPLTRLGGRLAINHGFKGELRRLMLVEAGVAFIDRIGRAVIDQRIIKDTRVALIKARLEFVEETSAATRKRSASDEDLFGDRCDKLRSYLEKEFTTALAGLVEGPFKRPSAWADSEYGPIPDPHVRVEEIYIRPGSLALAFFIVALPGIAKSADELTKQIGQLSAEIEGLLYGAFDPGEVARVEATVSPPPGASPGSSPAVRTATVYFVIGLLLVAAFVGWDLLRENAKLTAQMGEATKRLDAVEAAQVRLQTVLNVVCGHLDEPIEACRAKVQTKPHETPAPTTSASGVAATVVGAAKN